MNMKKKKAFTLIELLVVVAIMGLLSAVAVIALNNARARARDARRLSDIKQIQTALELYYLDQNQYPETPTASIIGGMCLDSTDGFDTDLCSGTTYMAEVSENPQPRTDGSCANMGYNYTVTPDAGAKHFSYRIQYCLGAITGGVAAGIRIATPAGISDP